MGPDFSVADVILRAAKVDRPAGEVYCIGPAVGRVSFASQQIRALNLVWAMRARGIIAPNSLVAVVGGGLAGLAAATALRANQCTTKVFESTRLLHRQRDTTHRHVHPTINWWPLGTFTPTTALPYLNWTMGQCNEVLETVLHEWAELRKQNPKELCVVEGVTVEDAVAVQRHGNRLTVITGKDEYEQFDAVIVASGFGDERKLDPTVGVVSPSYWDPDALENARNRADARFVVSGFGDGGLIDALRVAYDFAYGRLSFRVVELLQGTTVATRIEALERSRAQANWQSRCLEYEAIALSIADAEQGTELRAAQELLELALMNKKRLITLIDAVRDSPYEAYAAPVHKLMIAYAKVSAVLSYKKGEVAPTSDPNILLVCGERLSRTDTNFVVRIGAPPYRPGIITNDEWNQLLKKQELLGAWSYAPAWGNDNLPVPPGWHCPNTQAAQFVSAMRDGASKAFRAMGSLNVMIKARDGEFVVVNHTLPYRPDTLFGKKVNYLPDEEIEVASELA